MSNGSGNLKKLTILIFIGFALVVGVGVFRSYLKSSAVTDFETCVEAGNRVMEGFPRQCISGGKVFDEAR